MPPTLQTVLAGSRGKASCKGLKGLPEPKLPGAPFLPPLGCEDPDTELAASTGLSDICESDRPDLYVHSAQMPTNYCRVLQRSAQELPTEHGIVHLGTGAAAAALESATVFTRPSTIMPLQPPKTARFVGSGSTRSACLHSA